MFPDVSLVIQDVLRNGAKLAIVSRNNKDVIARALYYLRVPDPRDDNKMKSIISLVDYFECYDESKTQHMHKLKEYSKSEYADMILYDDDPMNNIVRIIKGAIFQLCPNKRGLTWSRYQEGLATWHRLRVMTTPFNDQGLTHYNHPMWIGFSGMDEESMKRLKHGQNRIDTKEAARWGYAVYITDDIRVAAYFREWIKQDAHGQNAQTYLCDIWVRDAAKWLNTQKIWVPADGKRMVDVHKNNESRLAKAQEDRDAWVAGMGTQTPYVLFARHWYMPGMDNLGLPKGRRFSEMAIYTHVQQAQLVTDPLSEDDIQSRLAQNKRHIQWEDKVGEWHINVPEETKRNIRRTEPTFTFR
jgi:magnesium-dependent phosphatase 1